jgi:hypothetical protein
MALLKLQVIVVKSVIGDFFKQSPRHGGVSRETPWSIASECLANSRLGQFNLQERIMLAGYRRISTTHPSWPPGRARPIGKTSVPMTQCADESLSVPVGVNPLSETVC